MSDRAGATSTSRRFLPYSKQTIEADDIRAVVEAAGADFLTTGPMVERFESAFASATGARYAVACNSGTAALHLAMLALGVGPGDSVIVPSLTFLASANAARYVGAEVIFADVDANSGLLGSGDIETALARTDRARPKAVVVVHINGQCADMEAIAGLAKSHGLAIVEDACHALGAEQTIAGGDRARVGACARADIACFSFHPVKGMTTAEGGAVTTADPNLAERASRIRNHGMNRNPQRMINRSLAFDSDGTPNPWYYEMPEVGYNYRLPDILCALGLSQLSKLQRFVKRRRELATRYDRLLASLPPTIRPVAKVPYSSHAYHLYAVLIDFEKLGLSRAKVIARLRDRGIGSQVHYLPVHRQPYYVDRYGVLELPGADAYYAQCLSLPMFPTMHDDDVTRVVDALDSLA